MTIRLGADKANIALREVRRDFAEMKNDVVARVTEVKNEVFEVKSDVHDAMCMRFSSRNLLRWRLNSPLRGTDGRNISQMVFAARPLHKL